MSDRFTTQEWEIVSALPEQAAIAAAVSDGVAVFGTLKEIAEGAEALHEGGAAFPDNQLISAIMAAMVAAVEEEKAALDMDAEGGPPPDSPPVDTLPEADIEPDTDVEPEIADELAKTAAPGDAVLAIEAPDVDPRDPRGFVHEVLGNAMQAREILAAKAEAGEAAEYTQWILGVVDRVINRTKTGSFLGIGGKRVDADEAEYRANLVKALGANQ